MPAEVEAKFRADSAEVLETLASAPRLAFAELGAPATALEVDRYLDTAGGRLAAVGWACRLRVRDGTARVSLKGPAVPTDGTWHHNRPEVEGPATQSIDPLDWPEGEARSLLLELAGGAPLVQATVLRQRRTERAVIVDGRPVATLSLDAVEVVGLTPQARCLWIVELELADETALDRLRFDELAGALMALGLRPDPDSKLDHALRLATG